MCMMSTGKAEISRLNEAVEETTKLVQELKSKLHERWSSPSSNNGCSLRSYNDLTDGKTNQFQPTTRYPNEEAENLSCGTARYNASASSSASDGENGENASSVVTEEQMMDMDQLETELELELQKLPLCMVDEASDLGTSGYSYSQNDEFHESNYQYSTSGSGGVSPYELSQKLSNVLIQQQEDRIMELESELNLAHTKLKEKEDELRSLKDCIKSLNKCSISPDASDEMYGESVTE